MDNVKNKYNMEEINILKMSSHDFNQMVADLLTEFSPNAESYEFEAEHEAQHDVDYSFTDVTKADAEKWLTNTEAQEIESGYLRNTYNILLYLVKHNLIPEHECYVIAN